MRTRIKAIYNFTTDNCYGDYVFYEYDQNFLSSKEKRNDVIIIDEDQTRGLPKPIPGQNEKEFSILFYYTPELDSSIDFQGSMLLLKEYFLEIIYKTNLGYQNSNISVKARMHCFEKATIRENISENMTVILDKGHNQ